MSERKETKINEIILRRLWADDKGKDLSFIVEEKTIRCHRWIVQEASEYFKLLLDPESNFSEGSKLEIQIKDISYDIFSSVILYFYTNEIHLDESNIWDFMEAAERFMIDALNETCLRYIKAHLTPELSWDLLAFTRIYKWKEEENKNVALDYIAKNPSACKFHENNADISISEWKFMVDIAQSKSKLSSKDIDIFLGKLIAFINEECVVSVERVSQISELLEKSVPLFEKFVSYGNALVVYSLGREYGCMNLKRIAIGKLKDISQSKDFLCSIDRSLFDSVIDDICKIPGEYHARGCGDVILSWINQNNTEPDHVLILFNKYSYQLSQKICRENVLDMFRKARSYGTSDFETHCLSFIDDNIGSLMDNLVNTSVEEIQIISNFHAMKEERGIGETNFPPPDLFLNHKRRRNAGDRYSNEKAFGETLEKWIMKNKESGSETVQNCIDTLIERHFFDLCNVSDVRNIRGFGDVILRWVGKHNTESDHVHTLSQKYSYQLSQMICSENVLEIFRKARSYGALDAETHCLSFIDENIGSLILSLANTSVEEIQSISNFHARKETNNCGNQKVEAYVRLLENGTISDVDKTYFPSAETFLNSEPRQNAKYRYSKENAFGKTLEKWIMGKKESDLEREQNCIDTLIGRHFFDIGRILSSRNIESVYLLALERNQRGLEAVCFSYILEHFKESSILVLNLPFHTFSSLLISISKLYKGDIRVHSSLGQMTTYWMAPLSEEFEHVSHELGFLFVERLCKRDDVNENIVLTKLGFLIAALLNEMDLDNQLSNSLMISAKMKDDQTYRKVQEKCIQKFPMMIRESQFMKMSSNELSRIIASDGLRRLEFVDRRYLSDTDIMYDVLHRCAPHVFSWNYKDRWDLSETDIMYAVIHWCTPGETFGSNKFQHATLSRVEKVLGIFKLLRPRRNLLQRLDLIERSPSHIEDNGMRRDFIRTCRQRLPKSSNGYSIFPDVPYDKREVFSELFNLLRIERIPFSQLFDVVEQFPYLINDERLQRKFLSACRQHFTNTYGIYFLYICILVFPILIGIILQSLS